jgi:hypothetical protein
MALSAEYIVLVGSTPNDLSNNNLTVPNITTASAYHVITGIDGNKECLAFSVDVYEDSSKEVYLGKLRFAFTLDLEGPNPIKQAYQFLKTLPEFSDAVDC